MPDGSGCEVQPTMTDPTSPSWLSPPVSHDPRATAATEPRAVSLDAFESPTGPDPSRDGYTGTAYAINRRIESRKRLPTEQIMTFRLERYSDRGDRLPPITVEMRGLTLTGGLSEGERVEVFGGLRGGVLFAHRVVSLTTGAIVSTRVSSLVRLRLGRRRAIAALLVLLALAALAIRFIPQIYYNTPFGKSEYRHDVAGTCARVTMIRQQPLPGPDGTFNTVTNGDPDTGVFYYRQTIDVVVQSRDDAIDTEYDGLLARITPLSLQTRRDSVARLVQQQKKLFAHERQLIADLPARVTLADLKHVSLQDQEQRSVLSANLAAALTALAGSTCSA